MKKGQTFKLSTDKALEDKGNAETVFIDYANMSKVLQVGNTIYVDDGLISLTVTDIGKNFFFLFNKQLIIFTE